MPAKNTRMITPEQAAAKVREMFGDKLVDSWLLEFGYSNLHVITPGDPLATAVAERGARIRQELVKHGKRLADRATMAPTRIVGRSSVVAP
jgi:hypothetical protein